MDDKSILLRQREDGIWEEKPEPYAVIECETEEDFNYIKQRLESTRWIPVEERLPEKEGEYLVTFAVDEKVRLVGYGCCRKDVLGNNIGFGWYDLYSGTYFSDKAFSAWQPLPEPYRENIADTAQSTVTDWKEKVTATFLRDSKN